MAIHKSDIQQLAIYLKSSIGIMSQYTPPAEYGRAVKLPPELERRVSEEEYELVCECVASLGFNGFAQDVSSADAAYTPEWDY